MADVFLDTSYIVALASPADQHHADALRLSDQLESGNHRMVTTRGVILEIGNALSRQRLRASAIHLLSRLRDDPAIEVVEVEGDLFEAGFDLYRRRSDKEWGLTDCLSFVVMWERRIADVLTADRHFRQAGFRPLLDSSQP